MVEVEYKPAEKVIIYNIAKYDTMEEFMKGAVPPQTTSLGWCKGILLSFATFPTSDELVSDTLRGITHIAAVYYCKYPEYKSIIKNTFGQELLIIDQSREEVVVAMTEFLQERDLKK